MSLRVWCAAANPAPIRFDEILFDETLRCLRGGYAHHAELTPMTVDDG
jgi:hypothetical protein